MVWSYDDLKGNFDHRRARKIREKAGLTLKQLSEETGFSQSEIDNCENGSDPPNPFYNNHGPINSSGRRYILWLSDQGYNPFHVSRGG